ncbi:MAG: rhomboid family intramembrane serine protease [Bacteroidetes bacterium HGW-Bacteroidetes-3]|jgi:membrane associated rhomboid family serine protease|nr:MAG: rhomboid family intramembrane serine protease [Bacteroidetes bacterium HGW-Bacteroidetes-3]
MSEPKSKFPKKFISIPVIAVFSIWLVYYLEIKFKNNFNDFGIYPQTLLGLRGIVFSPFLHSSIQHLFSNSIPLLVMLASLYYFYEGIATKVLLRGIFLTGFLTWTFARPSYHIGASGVVYFLVSFIFFSGVFRKYYRLAAVSLIVVFLYGSTVWYIFPIEEKISWEGHLSGFLVGFIFAYIFKKTGPQPEKFVFSQNPEFDELFDEHGNFAPPAENEVIEITEEPKNP